MDEDHGRAPIKLCPKRAKGRVTQIVARIVAEQNHAVGAKYVESIIELAKCTLEVRERQCREASEAVRPSRHQIGAELVDAASHRSPGGGFPSGYTGSSD